MIRRAARSRFLHETVLPLLAAAAMLAIPCLFVVAQTDGWFAR